MKVEEQAPTLCFSTPIWRLDFSDHESVNAAILAELEALGWDRLDERQRAIIHTSHSFSEDRFVSLQNYWVHATPPGKQTQFHEHKPAVFSGVYYVDKPQDSGDLVFVDVNPYHSYSPRVLPGKTDPITCPEITFEAEVGTMLIFPGWLPHKVPRNNSVRRRVSISFNSI